MRRAVIDVGSNSVTTTIAVRVGERWHDLHGSAVVTRLGEGTAASGLLKEDNIVATLHAIKNAWLDAGANDAEVVAAGTAALRIARNAEDLLDRARAQKTPVTVISGDDEAALGMRSVLEDPELNRTSDLAIVDIGGHSTELTLLHEGRARFRHSLAFGTLKIRGQYLDAAPDGRAQGGAVFAASNAVDDLIGESYNHLVTPFPSESPVFASVAPTEYEAASIDRPANAVEMPTDGDLRKATVVALGGGPAMLVAIRAALTEWDDPKVHAARLEYEELGRAVGWLMPMSDEERAGVIPLSPKLARTLPACALILERMLFALRAEGCLVSARGWRHALLADDEWFATLRKA